MDLDLFCPICLDSLTEADGIGLPNSCAHAFCAECIIAWSKCSSNCPIDRLDFAQISVKELDGHLREVLNVSDLQKDNDIGSSFVDNIVCEICRDATNENVLLLCDGCNKGFHCYCLNPPLYEVPLREWYCNSCSESQIQEEMEVIMIMSSEPGPSSAPSPSLSSPSTRRSQRIRKRRGVPRTRFVERIRQYIQVSREFAFDSDDEQGSRRPSKLRKKNCSRTGGSTLLADPSSENDIRKNVEIRRGIVDNLGLRKTRDCPGLSQFDVVSKGSTGSSMKSFNKLDLTGSRCAPVASDDEINLTPTKRKAAMIKPEDTNDFLGSLLKEQELNNLPGYQLKINVDGSLARREKEEESLRIRPHFKPSERSTNVEKPELLHQGLTLSVVRATDKARDHVSSVACFSESFMTEPVFDSINPECYNSEEQVPKEVDTQNSESERDNLPNAENVSALDEGLQYQETTEAAESCNPNVNQNEQDLNQEADIFHERLIEDHAEMTATNQNQVIEETGSPNESTSQELLDAVPQSDDTINPARQNKNDEIYNPFNIGPPQSETEEPTKSPVNQTNEFAENENFAKESHYKELLENSIPEVTNSENNIRNEELNLANVGSEPLADSIGSTNLIENLNSASISGTNQTNEEAAISANGNADQSDAESNFSGFGSDDLNKYEQDNSQGCNFQPSLASRSPHGNYQVPEKIAPLKKFEDTSCEVCECNHDEATMLLCDEQSCNRGFHMACLNPPLFDVPEGEWLCPTCRKSKEDETMKFAQPPPFKSRHSFENKSSANSGPPGPFKGYEIPKKSKNSDSRLSFSDLSTDEPSAEELEKLGLPVQFNMNNLLKSQETEEGPGGRDPEGRNERSAYEGRFDYHSRGWNFGRPPPGGRGGRWEMDRDRGNRGPPPFDRSRGGGFGSRFPGDRDRGEFRNRDGNRTSRWGSEQKVEFPFPNVAPPPFPQHQQQNREPPLELMPNSTLQQEQPPVPEQKIETTSNTPIIPPEENPVVEQEVTKTNDAPTESECPPTQSTEIEDTPPMTAPSRKRELSGERLKDKEENKEKTSKESRRRSRSKSSESRKRKRDRSSSRKRTDDGDRRRDRRKSRDHDRHRSRRSRSRSRKRYDSDRHSRHDDRRSSRDHRSRDSRHERNDERRSSRYDDDRRRSDYSRSNEPSRLEISAYDQPGSNSQTPTDLNIGAADKTPNHQLTPTKDEQQPSEPVMQLDAPPEVPQMVAPPDFGGFQRPAFGGFPHRFEGERPRFRSSFTPIQNRFQRPPRPGFNPRFPDAMPPFNAMPNAPMPDQQFNSLLGQGLNARFMSPDLMRGALPNALNGNLAFPNRFPGATINSPQNLLNTRLPFPFNNAAANNVNPLGAPGTIDPNVLQQFANTLANNATASTQGVQPIDDVQKLINSQANMLQVQQQQQQQSSQEAVSAAANSAAQTNVAALLRQIESNKLLQSVTSLNTPDNSAQLFPTSPKQLNPPPVQDSTPEPTSAQQHNVVGTSISPISISLAKVQSNMPMINSILESHFQNQQQPQGATSNPLQQIFGGNTSFPSQNSSPELVEMEDTVVSPRAESKPEKESVPFLDQLVRNVTSPTIPFMSGADDSVKSENAPSKPLVKPVIPKLDSDDEKNSDIEASANEMQLKKKMTDRSELQTKVADLVKGLLMPHFKKKTITKDEYKDIMRKSVNKVVKRGSSSSSQLKEEKIGKLVNAYVDHYKVKRSKGSKAAAVVDPDF